MIWDGDPDELGVEGAVLSGVDNITVDATTGDLYVAEDGGNMEVVIISAEGTVAPFLRIPEGHDGSEMTGPCFNPDRTRLYVSSQRAPTPKPLSEIIEGNDDDARIGGVTYEISGPFRSAPAAEVTTTTAATGDADPDEGGDDGDGSGTAVVVGIAVAVAAAVGGVIGVRRRREG